METNTLKELLIAIKVNPYKHLYTGDKRPFHKYTGILTKQEFFDKLSQTFINIEYNQQYPFTKGNSYTVTKPIKQLNDYCIGFDNKHIIICSEKWDQKYGYN